MGVARKLKKVLEKRFPPPDKVVLRDNDRIIGIITSKASAVWTPCNDRT